MIIKSNYKVLGFIAVLILGTSAVVVKNDKLFEISKNIELFVNTYQQLNTNYVDDLDPSELMKIGLDAMTESLDPYTKFISESQIESYRLSDEGRYQGVGAIVKKVGDYVTIIEPYEGGPAQNAGLKAGDQLVVVNGFDTKGKSNDEVNAIARGVPGTKLKLQVKRPGQDEIFPVELTRGEVRIPNVPYSGRVSENIGYISLTTFTQKASNNIAKALKDLKKDEGLDGVILDLRSNGGGLLAEAVKICNIFVPEGEEVVSIKGKVRDRDQSFKTRAVPVDTEIPLVVLINKSSASASEIVSGVMQDLDRGVIMGQRSYGKGLVQNTEEVGYNSRVKLTTSKYYIPSRRCIQSVEYENGEPKDISDDRRSKFKTRNGRTVLDGGGVTPDVKLPTPELSEYTQALLKESIIFLYVNEYALKNDSIAAAGDFIFEDYDDFKTYVQNSNFVYESNLEKELSKLINEESSESTLITEQLKNALQTVDSNQNMNLDNYKAEITKELEKEIISRYYFQSGKAKHRLNGDPEIQEAIDLLNDLERYHQILGM